MLIALTAVAVAVLLAAAVAVPLARSGRQTEPGALPLVAPRGSGFGDATTIVAACAQQQGAPAAVRTTRRQPIPRWSALAHRHAHA